MVNSKKGKLLSVLLIIAMIMQIFIMPMATAEDPTSAVEFAPPREPKTYGDDYNGSDMWLRYVPVSNASLRDAYRSVIQRVVIPVDKAAKLYMYSETQEFQEFYGYDTPGLRQAPGSVQRIPKTTLQAIQFELEEALNGMLGAPYIPIAIGNTDRPDAVVANSLIVGTPDTSGYIKNLGLEEDLEEVGKEGYIIKSMTVDGKPVTVIAGNTEIGALYGTFAFIRKIQTQKPITNLNESDSPKIQSRRILGWEKERLYGGNNPTNTSAGLNGESGYIFNFDLAVPGYNPSGNAAHTTSAAANINRLALPVILDRYVVVARALASVGVNEFNLNNVNIVHAYLSEWVIRQEAALADLLRPYGIHVALSAGYDSPNQTVCNQAGQKNYSPSNVLPRDIPADLTTRVLGTGSNGSVRGKNAATGFLGDWNSTTEKGDEWARWWLAKTNQLRRIIPDFVGWTMKAGSEGQPGPVTHSDTHTTGSMLMGRYLTEADGGPATLWWRSFVYDAQQDHDRLNRAYMSFYDGDDADVYPDHILIQNKNGPLDFQSREILHPMFGRMKNTNQAAEVQITMEYLGFSNYMTYLGPLWEEFFKFDTYAEGPGTLVGNILDGSAQGQTRTGICGVNNMGNSDNITGHDFLQANTYAFGRMAWDWTLKSEDIAEEWVRMTWTNDDDIVETIVDMMMGSREAVVDAQNTLGLLHQQSQNLGGDHFSDGWWDYNAGQDDWCPVYYNQAMKDSIGFRRTVEGRKADLLPVPNPGTVEEKLFPLTNQLFEPNKSMFEDINTIPEEFLLQFHNVPWDYVMKSGNTLYEELIYRHQRAVQYATYLRETWKSLEGKIDSYRWDAVHKKLITQEFNMARWRATGIEYWQAITGRDMPTGTAPLSIEIEVAGQRYGDFDISHSLTSWKDANGQAATMKVNSVNAPASGAGTQKYVINVPLGTEVPSIDKVIPYNENAIVEIIKQAEFVGDTAIVKVTLEDVYNTHVWDHSKQWGKWVQNYTFEFQYANTLKEISVGGIALKSFKPEKTSYTVYVDPSQSNVVEAITADPAATVSYNTVGNTTTITVKNADSPDGVYTVKVLVASEDFMDDFDSLALDARWFWKNEDSANWQMGDGAMTITTQRGDFRNTDLSAKNILLTNAPEGDWTIETKIDLSRTPGRNLEKAGIIVYWNDTNFFTLTWGKRAATSSYAAGLYGLEFARQIGTNRVSSSTHSLADVSIRAAGPEQRLIWLRMEKRENNYIAFFSNNGKDWKPFRLDANNLRPTLRTGPGEALGVPKVGLITYQHSANSNADGQFPGNLNASYDYFKVTQNGEKVEEEVRVPEAVLTADSSVESGATFTVEINLNNLEQTVYAQDITLSYDSNVFEYVSASGAGDNIRIVKEDKADDGKVRFIVADIGGVSGESTNVMNVTFKVKAGVYSTTGTIAITKAELGVAPEGTVIEAGLDSKSILIRDSHPGTDKSALIAAINNAQSLYDASEVGTEPGQYPQEARDALYAAINAAKAVKDNPGATQSQVDSAVIALNDAVDIFKDSVIKSSDLNNDGTIDVGDLAIVAYYYGVDFESPAWTEAKIADMNNDNIIDIADLAYVALRIPD